MRARCPDFFICVVTLGSRCENFASGKWPYNQGMITAQPSLNGVNMAGRKPFKAVDVLTFGIPDSRLQPPSSLKGPERRVFIDLIAACPAAQFQSCDMPLLCVWATAAAQVEQAAGELAAGGMITTDGKVSPWFTIQQQAARTLALLALRLRLGPQSRSRMAPKTVVGPMSYYDRQRFEERDDGQDETGEAH
jgi:Phage terminase, small subunit